MRVKSFLFPLFLLALLPLAGCSGKLAVVKPEIVYEDSEAVQAGMEYLQGRGQELQDEILAAQEAGGKKRGSREEAQRKTDDIQRLYGAEERQVRERVNQLFLKALETCRLRGRYTAIILADAAIVYDPAADITRKVIEEMNKTSLTFTPVSPRDGEAPAPSGE
ncbi:MAG: hypothetical protein LBO77_08160 [Desulfovibrio sp.]|nr:hypothetical protein [Desulfovibrio sp.]